MAKFHIQFKFAGEDTLRTFASTRSAILKKEDIDEANESHSSQSFTLSREIWNLIMFEAKRINPSKIVNAQSVDVTVDTDDDYYCVPLKQSVVNACYNS